MSQVMIVNVFTSLYCHINNNTSKNLISIEIKIQLSSENITYICTCTICLHKNKQISIHIQYTHTHYTVYNNNRFCKNCKIQILFWNKFVYIRKFNFIWQKNKTYKKKYLHKTQKQQFTIHMENSIKLHKYCIYITYYR